MSGRWQARVAITIALAGMSSCSHIPNPVGESYPTYHTSAFNDLNPAPKNFAPAHYDELEKGDKASVYRRAKADYYFTLGDSYSLQGNQQKAIEAFKSVLVYDSKSAAVYQRLATEYIKAGNISDALTESQKAVELDPAFVDGRLLLGGIYSSLRMFEQAIEQYKKVLEIDPENSEAPLYVGALLAERREFDRAVEYFTTLIENKKFENKYLAHYYIARVRVEQNTNESKKQAETFYKNALRLKPRFEDALLNLGSLYRHQAQGEKERKLYSDYQRQHGPSSRVAQELAKIYMEIEDYSRALEQYEIAEEGYGDDLGIKVKIALIYIERKDYAKALPKLHEVIELAPDSDKIRFYLAAVYEEIKDYNSAIAHFRKVPVGSPFYSEAIIHAAYAHKIMGEPAMALELVGEALKERQDVVQFYTLYASLLDEAGRPAEALRWLVDGSKLFSQNAQVFFYLGALRDKLGQKDAMIEDMRKVISLDPEHAQALNYLAFTLAERNENLAEAEEMARRALKKDPNDAYILDTLGWILLKRGNTPMAIQYLEAAVARLATESIIVEHLGDAYFKSQLMGKAKRMYLQAIEIETDQEKRQKIRAKISAIDQQREKQASVDEERKPASNPTQ